MKTRRSMTTPTSRPLRTVVTVAQATMLCVGLLLCMATSTERDNPFEDTHLTRVESYDAASDTWTGQLAMPRDRHDFAATFLGGKLHLTGGQGPMASNYAPVLDLDVFDPATGTWETRAAIPRVHEVPITAASGGSLFVVGSRDRDWRPLGDVDRYDPTTDTWETRSPLPAPRANPLVAQLGDKLYLFSGNDGISYRADAYVYDLAADQWATVSAPLTPRIGAAVEVISGKVYAAGGFNAQGSRKDLEVYNPATDIWTVLADLPAPRNWARSVATTTHIYVVGGLDASTRWNDSEIYAYEVAADRWTTLPGPATGVLEGSAAVIQGSLYLFGGTDPGSRLPRNDVVRFDPSTGTWEPRSPMPTARFGTQAIPDGGSTVYVISGWTRRRR